MHFEKLLIEAGKALLGSGLTVETWGNLSARDPLTGHIYITPSGVDYHQCREEDIAVFSPQGEMLYGCKKPSIETGLHLAVYRRRKEICAIVHTHPVASSAFACIGREIPLITDEAAQTLGDTVKVCTYQLPGSEELADACAAALTGRAKACLLKSHGAVCIGTDMNAAFKVARILEMTAEIYWRICAMNVQPAPISKENIHAMQQFMENHYGQ